MEPWKEELYHHGIKGQRWGVRNGPPYPLKDGQHSRSEEKAGWRKSLNNQKKVGTTDTKDKEDNKKKQALKILVTAGAVAAGAYLGYKLSDPEFRWAMQLRTGGILDGLENWGTKHLISDLAVAPLKTLTNNTIEDNFKFVNPTTTAKETFDKYIFGLGDLDSMEKGHLMEDQLNGRLENCALCTAAGVLREMGYDVEACAGSGASMADQLMWFDSDEGLTSIFYDKELKNPILQGKMMAKLAGIDLYDGHNSKEYIWKLEDALLAKGEGSFGVVNVMQEGYTSGHAIMFKVIDGIPKLIDNQTKTLYNTIEEFFTTHPHFEPELTTYRDLTNATPDWNLLIQERVIQLRSPN